MTSYPIFRSLFSVRRQVYFWSLFFLPVVLAAQEAEPGAQAAPDTSADSVKILESLPPGFMDSTAPGPVLSRKSKSPGGAVLRSLAVPGWGQLYTGHPVRAGVVCVLETAFFTTAALKFRDRNSLSDRLHTLEREMGESGTVEDPERVALNARIKSKNRQAGDHLAYGITTLLLGLIDSYVSAHLYHFEENLQVRSAAFGAGIEVCLRF